MSGWSQRGTPPHPIPGLRPGLLPTLSENHQKLYRDSTEFNKIFEQLYPVVRPVVSMHDKADLQLRRLIHFLTARGIDSLAAYRKGMAAIDTSLEHEVLFRAWRDNFNAKELSTLLTFFRTPLGKHLLEVEEQLVFARTRELDNYVTRTIAGVLSPMMRQATPPTLGPAPKSKSPVKSNGPSVNK